MQIHELVQGSPEWQAYRAEHFNASDAPAMLGCSQYKSRTALLQEYATGISKDIDAATQRIFDDGHRYEALARPLAENIIGEDLYPVVGSDGKYSASFDGLTMDESAGFEHKSLNDDLRAIMVDGCTGADLPKMYRVQMEQQCMVSGCSRILFMASKWEGDELVEERHCWYEPDLSLRAEIIAGWEQFALDVANYTPAAAAPEAVGRTPESLPALRIEVTGMVTASNLDQFKEHAIAMFQGINRELATDQHFADAEKTVKWCKDVEDRLAAAKQHALSQTESIDALFRAIDEIAAEVRATRLELDKLVEARKKQIRIDIQNEGVKAMAKHIESLNDRLGKVQMPVIPADFAGVMKGKRTIDSLRDAVDTELARAKIAANEVADRIQTNLNWYAEHAAGYEFLFADLHQLVLKDGDYFQLAAKNRIDDHKVAEKAKEEAKAKAQQEAKKPVGLSDIAQLLPTGGPREAMTGQPIAAIQPPADTGARIKLGEICGRLGFMVTAEFLRSLGFDGVREKGAVLFRESDFIPICMSIAAHIGEVARDFSQGKQAA
jgi:predicted phage-related endonuclease